MDLKTLKTFHAIVKYGSFNRAAQVMNYVQSTVTMQIQKLEAEMGVSLIERGSGKELRLTEAGRWFYNQSLEIVKNLEQLQSSLSEMRSGEAGHLRLGATEPTASYRLPGILGRFMSIYPNIRISVEIANTPVLGERVRQGEIAFALATAPGLGSGLSFEPLFAEEFAVLLPENHPLAEKEIIEPEDFQGHRLLITSATCPYRRKLETILQEKGEVALDTMEIGSMTALKFYVRNGLGIALVPKIAVEPETKETTVRMISGSLIHMTFGLLRLESAYPLRGAAEKLYHYLKQELASG